MGMDIFTFSGTTSITTMILIIVEMSGHHRSILVTLGTLVHILGVAILVEG
jgi:hypothetical protein